MSWVSQMADKKILSARASKWMLALVLILALSIAASPFVSAAKDAEKENKGGNGGTMDNAQLPGDNQDNSSEDQKELKTQDKDLKEELKENVKELKENNLPDDNELPEEQDNESTEQPEDEAQDQPENIVDESPIDDSADVSPDQTNNSANQDQEVQQPVITIENEQATIPENEDQEFENSAEEETTPILVSEESVGKAVVETGDDQSADESQEIEGGVSDQSGSQQNQAAAGITDSSASSAAVLPWSVW